MGCAASTPGPVAGSESGHAGSHPSTPSATPEAASAQGGGMKNGAGAMNGGSSLGESGGGKQLPVPAAKSEQQGEPSKQLPVPNIAARRRQSSEEFAASMNGPNAEPTFIPVTKGKVSDATFGVNEEVLRPRNRSQDDAGPMAQQLGLMQSSPLLRLDSDSAARSGGGAGAGTRGGAPGAQQSQKPKNERLSRQKMALTRHTLDTAPGAQGVVRHKEWVTANGGRRGHKNVIESQPERIAGKKLQMAPVPEERRLDRLEARFLKETLAKHWLFEKFSDAQFTVLTKNCETVDLRAGQPLIVQGAEDDGRMYILHRGTLSVHVLDAKKKEEDKRSVAKGRDEPSQHGGAGRDSNGRNERPSDPPAPAKAFFERGMHVATVLSGGWVGDMALLYKTTRTATVIAEADSRVLAVPRLAYENVIAEGYEAEVSADATSNEFAAVPVLTNVKDSNVLTQQGRATSWAAGDVLIESGSGARELLIITQGEVEFENRLGSAPAAGGEYRWSLQGAFITSELLRKGDVLAAGRPGDESLLVTLHNAGSRGGLSAKLKLLGGLPKGASSAVATSAGKGYRFYMQDIVTHASLIEPLATSLEGIRALLQCTPALSASLNATSFDSASFVMQALKFNAGETIPVTKDLSGGVPLAVLVSGKVAVRREDDVSIRAESERPAKPEPADAKKPVDEGIIARLYDVLSTVVPDDQPGLKLVAKSQVTVLAMNRADYTDLAAKKDTLAAVRSYPPKRPPSSVAAFGGTGGPGSDGNALKLSDISFERKIGQGAYGAVYLVVHKPTNKTLAAKIIKLARLRKHQKDDAINVERHVMQDSDNPFIVRLYASYKTSSHLLLVMEAGLGGELFSFLLRQEHQVLREDSVRFYGACVLSGLAAMHADGYMYRDLKPENVVITADGYCKIVDFGFAKRTAARTYTVCGTNAYLSPEMLTVQGHNFEVDYWAFGVFLYEMAIGCASFNVEADGTMNHEMPPFRVCQNILNASYKLRFDIGIFRVSPELQDVITQLLDRRVEHRIGCRVRGPDELYDHPFFAPIDFEKLKRFEYQPPWNPELQNGLDTRYFESTHKMRKSELIAFGIQD
ncbi:hypothetical protein KFE25_013786 [Diacronema lutheri]|uniref:cGMP-dependent protein kinase n=2 Tax=Diacronema lutheri TaxID=2081491 RepID=A0A8J5XNW8_DIALT|nr:hypothetical protein KFE25_013786 [Diacronema lutheri]